MNMYNLRGYEEGILFQYLFSPNMCKAGSVHVCTPAAAAAAAIANRAPLLKRKQKQKRQGGGGQASVLPVKSSQVKSSQVMTGDYLGPSSHDCSYTSHKWQVYTSVMSFFSAVSEKIQKNQKIEMILAHTVLESKCYK